MERKYKDSGIEWIGKIPETWEYKRFKYSGVFVKGKLPNSSNIENIGLPIIGASEMLGKNARTYTSDASVPQCKENDILILWDGANAGITASGLNGVVSSTVVKYTCLDKCIMPKYAAYLLKYAEHYFKEKVNGTTIPHMNMAYVNDIPLICPLIDEQQRIADYLDEKCGEIDSLIALQEQMIEKLKAYKQSVITEAVTKGLDSNAKLVPSGIDWIGKIPEGWNLIRLKFLCTIQTGNQDTQDADKDGDYPFYVRSPQIERSHKYTFEGEGILMAGDGAGAGRVFHHAYGKYAVHQRVYRLANFHGIDTNYLFYFISSTFCKEMDRGSAQSTVPSVRLPMLTNFTICIPSIKEQRSIASYLDEKCADIDRLIALKQQKIESLKEYKKSVVYEAVTGKTTIE